jgi:hypothetical protein
MKQQRSLLGWCMAVADLNYSEWSVRAVGLAFHCHLISIATSLQYAVDSSVQHRVSWDDWLIVDARLESFEMRMVQIVVNVASHSSSKLTRSWRPIVLSKDLSCNLLHARGAAGGFSPTPCLLQTYCQWYKRHIAGSVAPLGRGVL